MIAVIKAVNTRWCEPTKLFNIYERERTHTRTTNSELNGYYLALHTWRLSVLLAAAVKTEQKGEKSRKNENGKRNNAVHVHDYRTSITIIIIIMVLEECACFLLMWFSVCIRFYAVVAKAQIYIYIISLKMVLCNATV